jgi:glycosyltransferase involved in cell wall biosynthesis
VVRTQPAALSTIGEITDVRSPPLMQILLVQNASYFPSFAGSGKSDRLLMQALAQRGHRCSVVARPDDSLPSGRDHVAALNARGIRPAVTDAGAIVFTHESVAVHVVTAGTVRAYAVEQFARMRPDVVLVSTDPLNNLVGDLANAGAEKVVYLARTTTLLPFGPDAAFPSRTKTEAIQRVCAVTAVSGFLADYIRRHSGIEAQHVPIQLLEAAEGPALGAFENRFVTMVNPCALKGIAVFLALADLFPHAEFAAVPTWGTTSEDRAALAARPNVRILDPVDDVRDLLRQTRVMLVPSLWPEARARILVESLLHGVPVLASDVGGNREAAMGLPCLLPVTPIVEYERRVDERLVRVPRTPAQDVGSWRTALHRLLTDRDDYQATSMAARQTAERYAATTNVDAFEAVLTDVHERTGATSCTEFLPASSTTCPSRH